MQRHYCAMSGCDKRPTHVLAVSQSEGHSVYLCSTHAAEVEHDRAAMSGSRSVGSTAGSQALSGNPTS